MRTPIKEKWYYTNDMTAARIKYQARGISLRFIGWIISIFALVISGLLIFSMVRITQENEEVNKSTQNYITMKGAANDVQLASDDLTNDVRLFVTTGDTKYFLSYFKEADETQRRDKALEIIHELTEDSPIHDKVHEKITAAVNESRSLMELEYYAMKLTCLDKGIDYTSLLKKDPNRLNVPEADAVAAEDRFNKALDALFGQDYMNSKTIIISNVDNAIELIDALLETNIQKSEREMRYLIVFQSVLIATNVVFLAGLIILMHAYVINPMNQAVKSLYNNEEVHVKSNKEFNYLSSIYNRLHKENEDVKENLKYEAEHDKLTGLYNRTGYDRIYRGMSLDRVIYILLDIDKFKDVNDTLGHEMGDKVLQRTAKILRKYFDDKNCYIFRIGGDEFTILINKAGIEIHDDVLEKCKKMDLELARASGNIPGTTLSIGVALGAVRDTADTLFRKADKALYEVKRKGRAGVSLYEKE